MLQPYQKFLKIIVNLPKWACSNLSSHELAAVIVTDKNRRLILIGHFYGNLPKNRSESANVKTLQQNVRRFPIFPMSYGKLIILDYHLNSKLFT